MQHQGEQVPEEVREQELREDCYLFLAGLLNCAPAQEQLDALAQLQTDGGSQGEIADAWRAQSAGAQGADQKSVGEEFFNLFVGLGRGELVPFGSWYITGFLQEQPLAGFENQYLTMPA